MNKKMLAKVIRQHASAMHEEGGEKLPDYHDNMDRYELLRAFARSLEGRPLHECFGSIGDWGYNSPIGQALCAKPE